MPPLSKDLNKSKGALKDQKVDVGDNIGMQSVVKNTKNQIIKYLQRARLHSE